MKITAIRVYQTDLPLVEGRYSWADGKYVEVFDSTAVAIETDTGLEGYGEVCPLDVYLPRLLRDDDCDPRPARGVLMRGGGLQCREIA